MYDRTLEIKDEFPNKRLLVHFMQPHFPFIGSDFESGNLKEGNGSFFWHELMTGERKISKDDIWKAYTNTLKEALPFVSDLLERLEGKTIVTSDHGNMIGERAFPVPIVEWGHPPGIYTEELVKVPWFVHENGDRKKIVTEPTQSRSKQTTDDIVDDRLKQLGYK
jgi:hypothetical protein